MNVGCYCNNDSIIVSLLLLKQRICIRLPPVFVPHAHKHMQSNRQTLSLIFQIGILQHYIMTEHNLSSSHFRWGMNTNQ